MSTKTTKPTKATNKARARAPGRTATKLVPTLTNGPALLGYARVSTSDQDTSIQQAKLRDAGSPSFELRRRRARPETAQRA